MLSEDLLLNLRGHSGFNRYVQIKHEFMIPNSRNTQGNKNEDVETGKSMQEAESNFKSIR